MKGAIEAIVPVFAAFVALEVTCFASPCDEYPEHQLVPDASINDALLALTKSDYSTDGSLFDRWSWGPFVFNVTSWHSNIDNAFQPFTRYSEGGDAMVDAEFEFSWVASAECAVGDGDDVLATASLTFSQAVAKVRFHLSMFSGNESFTLHPGVCASDAARSSVGERVHLYTRLL
ncbi:hypothetical protein MTO96_026638 [Rhipicephalus appendiculatus]